MSFKTKQTKLKNAIKFNFLNKTLTNEGVETLMGMIENYEKINLSIIEKSKKEKLIESRRISGALKQSIHAHGDITKELIGSATKRIMGTLLSNQPSKKSNKFIKPFLIGLTMGVVLTIGFLLI